MPMVRATFGESTETSASLRIPATRSPLAGQQLRSAGPGEAQHGDREDPGDRDDHPLERSAAALAEDPVLEVVEQVHAAEVEARCADRDQPEQGARATTYQRHE